MSIRRNRFRPKYEHGCPEPCERKYPGYCPERVAIRPKTGPVKSKSGRRPFPIPRPTVVLARLHREGQDHERIAAGSGWVDEGWVIDTATGEAVNPRTDWSGWKDLLHEAEVRDARLYDARHTAATSAPQAGILDRAAQELFGWATGENARRYRNVMRAVRRDAADRIEALVWSPRLVLESGIGIRNATPEVDSQGPPNNKRAPDPRFRRSGARSTAVMVGFEPTVACTTHAFEACSLGRSDTSPWDTLPDPRRCFAHFSGQ